MISKLMLIELVTIQEKKQLLINRGIPTNIINNLLLLDPTNKNKTDVDKVGSYTDWIVSRYLKDREFNNFDKLHLLLQLYDKSKHKIPGKQMQNIGYFNSLDELIDFVNNNQDKLSIETNKFIVKSESGYDTFYSRDFIIQVPHTEELSIKLGSGTKWCTSLINNNMFNQYYADGVLLYITNKTKHLERYNLFLNLDYDANLIPLVEFADDKNRHLTYKLFDIVKQDNTLIPLIKKYLEYKNIEITELLSTFINCDNVNSVVLWYKSNIDPNANLYFETDDRKIINILTYNPDLYKYISNPSQLVQLLSVSKNGFLIMYIENPNKDIQLLLVSQNGDLIEYISNPDKDVQLLLVLQDGNLIRHITKPDKDIQLLLVSQTGYLMRYIPTPDKDVQLLLVSQDGNLIHYIKKPDKDVQMLLVSQNGILIRYIIKKRIPVGKDIQMLLISQNADLIQFIPNPDKDVQLLLVKKYGKLIYYIRKPDKDVQMLLVNQNGYLIAYIKNPDKDVQLLLVKQNGRYIDEIKNPDKDVQLLLIRQNPYLYLDIRHPDPELTLLYRKLRRIKESVSYVSKLLDVN